MKNISKRSIVCFLTFLLSFGYAADLFVPNFDPIILKNLNIEYEWFENLLEQNIIENDCSQINAQLPQIEFAYNTIQNFQLNQGEETMKDLDNIRKLMGNLEVALDQQYEQQIFNESQFTEELSNVQRELKKKIIAQVINSNQSQVEIIQWTDDLNETQYLSKISEETYLLSIKKQILSTQINENSNSQTLLIQDANNTVSKLMILLEHYFELYQKSIKLNKEMILIFELNQYIIENEMTQFDNQKLESSYTTMKKDFQQIQNEIQQIQKLYQKMKNLLMQMIQKIELISEEKESTLNQKTEINDIIQKYQILSSIFKGIQEQEESNKTLSELIQKQEYIMNYQETLKNLDEMYTLQLTEAKIELSKIENNSYIYKLKQDTIQEIIEQQSNLKIQTNQIQEEQNKIETKISEMQQEREQFAKSYNQLEQEYFQLNKNLESLELNISKIQNWLHNSLLQIQNYTEIKISYQNKLETLRNQNKEEEIKNAEYNIKVISDWLLEQQKKYLQYQKYEENLFQEINALQKKKEEIKQKIEQYQVEEESSKLQFYSFVESQASFVNYNGPSELEQLLQKSQKTMNELNKLKEGQKLLLQEYEKLVKEKQEKFSISTQFQSFLEMKGFDLYDSKLYDPEYKAIIQSDEFKQYQQAQEFNFIEKQNDLLEQQQILAKLNQDIAAKEDELQTISVNVDACVVVCSVVGHRSEGNQLSFVGSEISNNPKDDVSSRVAGSLKAKTSMKENYATQKPEIYGKQYGTQSDEESGKSLIQKIDIYHNQEKLISRENWSSNKRTGKFQSNVSTSIIVFVDLLQNNITTMIHSYYEVTSNITSKIIIFEEVVDRKQNKSTYQVQDKIHKEHTSFEGYDIYNSKVKTLKEDIISSIVKIKWTNVIGSIMEGAPEDEVSSKVVINGKIETSFKSYSGKVMDYKEIQAIHNFADDVSSRVIQKQKENQIEHKDNYVKQGIVIAEATYGLLQEIISLRQQGKIRNQAFSSISGVQKDQVSSRAIHSNEDKYSEYVEKTTKDRKLKKSKVQFIDLLAMNKQTQFEDQVSSKSLKAENKIDNQQVWEKQPDLVSSKAIKPKNKLFIRARYQPPTDSVSSKVISHEGTIIHVHKILQISDEISEGKKISAVSKYALKKKLAFTNRMAIQAGWKEQVDSVSSRIIQNQIDQVSSKKISTIIDIIHHIITAPLEDDVSSIIHANPQSIYAIRKSINIIDAVSSKIVALKQDLYASKHKYELKDKILIKANSNLKDTVSSKIHSEMKPKIAIKSTSQFTDDVSSRVIGEIKAILGYIISTEHIEDEVSSQIVLSSEKIVTSNKAYSGAIVDEVAGQTTFVNYLWLTSHISFISLPQNNITSKIIIYSHALTNVTTAIHKFVHIQNNISTEISIFESISNDISTLVKFFVDIEDEVSSKAFPGKMDQIAYKSQLIAKDSVSSRVHQTEEDDVNSKAVNQMLTLISEKVEKKINDKISVSQIISKENRFAIKAQSPKIKEIYSGQQTEWTRQHSYTGMISKCDCEDDVSSIVDGLSHQDYYSKAKMGQQVSIISVDHQFSYKDLFAIQFAGEFLDEVSSKAVQTLTTQISEAKKLTEFIVISSIVSTEQFQDQISSRIHNSPFIQTSFKSYSGKITDYEDIKAINNFQDYVSSRINTFEPIDTTSRKIVLTHQNLIAAKTSFKKQNNVTSNIVFFADLINNVTSQLTDNAEFHNISTAIKIFYSISSMVTSDVFMFEQPEENVSSIEHSLLVAKYADIISWVEFEDEVSSKVYPGTEFDKVSSTVYSQQQNEITEKENCEFVNKFAFKFKHSFIEEINQKHSGKLINQAFSKTNFFYQDNVTTHIHIFESLEISNITSHQIKFFELTNNVSTEITIHKPLDLHNISTSITEVQEFNNITSHLVQFVSLKINNITSEIIIFEELGNIITTGFYGSASNEFSHKLYDGGIEDDEKNSKTTYQPVDNITSGIILYGEILNYCTSELIVFSFENLAASKTSRTQAINNITTNLIIFEEISNNITSKTTDFIVFNNISSSLKIFIELQNNISTHRIDFVPIQDEISSKAISNLITIVSSIISDLELKDQVSSKVYSSEKDRLSVKNEIPIPLDILHAKTNVLNQNKTARQSLVDYWLCDYVGEVFSYVAHKTTANVAGLSQYSNEMNSNTLINTARNLALLLKNTTYEKTKLKPSNNVDQLLQLTNSYQMNGLNIHYYTQLRELLKVVKIEIDYFYLVLAKQQQLYTKRRAFKNLLENLSKQKDKCMIPKKPKTNLRKRSEV